MEGAILNNMGESYYALSQYSKALEFCQRALGISQELGDRENEGASLNNIGMVYEKQKDLQQALNFYQKSITANEKIRSFAHIEEFKTNLAEQSVDVYQRAALLCLRLSQPTEAFNLAERARARTFLDQVGNPRIDIRKGPDAQLIEQEQALQLELTALEHRLLQERAKASSQLNKELVQSLATRLTGKRQEHEDLRTRLKLVNPEYASLVSVDPLKLPEIQKLLDQDTTLLSYFVTPDKILAFVVTRESLQTIELPVSEKNLDAAITWFRGFASRSDSPLPSLTKLYAWLIAPLKAHLKTPVVAIVPNGILNYLPFAALTDGKRYLDDDYTLFYLPSASTLQFIQQKRKDGSGNVLALAYSQPDNLPRLLYADDEAKDIAKLYQTQAIIGRAATESALRAQANKFHILHLAAHGELNTASPLFSRIVLAPDQTSDGSLEVQEVYDLDLAKASLVVLSACQTQLGKQSRGDDIIGLNRAFIYAGAPTVIASLWKVDDEATSFLMTAFYAHLKQGKGKAAALRAAQRETRAKYPHPYYWAAFVLTGAPGAQTQK
jgi:CHAT domain-containing protein